MLPATDLAVRDRLLEQLVAAAGSTPSPVPLDLSGAENTARILAAEVAVL